MAHIIMLSVEASVLLVFSLVCDRVSEIFIKLIISLYMCDGNNLQ